MINNETVQKILENFYAGNVWNDSEYYYIDLFYPFPVTYGGDDNRELNITLYKCGDVVGVSDAWCINYESDDPKIEITEDEFLSILNNQI